MSCIITTVVLGLNAHTLRRWQGEVEQTKPGAFPGHGRVACDREELQQLRDENKRRRMARDMLQKALGSFASASR